MADRSPIVVAANARRQHIQEVLDDLPVKAEAALKQLADLRLHLIAAVLCRIRQLEETVRVTYMAKRAALDTELRESVALSKRAAKLTSDSLQAVAVMGDVDVLSNSSRLAAALNSVRFELESLCDESVEDETLDIHASLDPVLIALSKFGDVMTVGGGLTAAAASEALVIEEVSEGQRAQLPDGLSETAYESGQPMDRSLLSFRISVKPSVRVQPGYDEDSALYTIVRGLDVAANILIPPDPNSDAPDLGTSYPLRIVSATPVISKHCVEVDLGLRSCSLSAAFLPPLNASVVIKRVEVHGIPIPPAAGPALPRTFTVSSPSVGVRFPAEVSSVSLVSMCSVLVSGIVHVAAACQEHGHVRFLKLRPYCQDNGLLLTDRCSGKVEEGDILPSNLGLDHDMRACAANEAAGVLYLAGTASACSKVTAYDCTTRSTLWTTSEGSVNGCFGVCVLPSLGCIIASSYFDSRLLVLSQSDGTVLESIDCSARGLQAPSYLTADDASSTVFVSARLADSARHVVAAWRWDLTANKGHGSWIWLGELPGLGTSVAHPLAVVNLTKNSTAAAPDAGAETPKACLVVGTLATPELAVFSLPGRQLSHSCVLRSTGSCAARLQVGGLAGHPRGLVLHDAADGSIRILSWPLSSRYVE